MQADLCGPGFNTICEIFYRQILAGDIRVVDGGLLFKIDNVWHGIDWMTLSDLL